MATAMHTCTIAVSDEEVRWSMSTARFSEFIGFDTETDGIGRDAMGIGISLATNRECQCGRGHYWGVYIPFGHQTDQPQASMKLVRDLLQKLIADMPATAWVIFNRAFDNAIIMRNTFNLLLPWDDDAYDVWHMAYLIDENAPDHKLKSVGARLFGEEVRDAERALEPYLAKDMEGGHIHVPPDVEAPYAAGDARLTIAIREKLMPSIDSEGLRDVLRLETALIPVIADMEYRGVLVDVDYMAAQEVEARARLEEIDAEFIRLSGRDINVNSDDQLRQLLFAEWKLPVHRRTPKGEASVDRFAIERLAGEAPEEYRAALFSLQERAKLSKYVESFFMPLQTKVDPEGIVRTRFTQMVRTGRMSSASPNLQQIPTKDHQGKPDNRVRMGFKVRPGKVWLLVDYSQIELRLLAWYSQSFRMKQAYSEGLDIHQQTADLLNIERKIAKNVNFAQVYGAGVAQLARTAGTTESEAARLKAIYKRYYPEVTWFSKAAQQKAEERGWVKTVSGRRRRFHEKFYSGANAIIQGSAADVMKTGMLAAWKAIQPLQREGRAHLVLTIHDELIFEVDAGLEADVYALVRPAMLSAFVPPIEVPLNCDARVATVCWGEAEDFPKDSL
jgi:DNA polymerase-1